MAITGADLLAGQSATGALTTELLLPLKTNVPGAEIAEDVAAAYAIIGTARTATWLDATRRDAGAIAWAHYRALTDRAQQLYTIAASISADDASRSYQVSAQAKGLEGQAATYLAAFLKVEAAELAPSVVSAPPLTSRQTVNRFAW